MIKYLVAYVVLGLAAFGIYSVFVIAWWRFYKKDYDSFTWLSIEHEVSCENNDTFIDKVAAIIEPVWLYYLTIMLVWPMAIFSLEFETARKVDRIYEERLKEEAP